MFSEHKSVGLDVRARSVVACGIDTETGELVRQRLAPEHADILEWIATLPGPVAVAYEAGHIPSSDLSSRNRLADSVKPT